MAGGRLGPEGAEAEVRLRHVAETAPEEAIAQNPDWLSHRAEMDDDPLASLGPARGIVFAA